MTRLLFSTFACAAAVPLLTIAAPQAPSLRAQARAIPSTQAVEAVKLLSSYADVLGAPDTVAGVRAFERDVLATDTLTLQPNSRLVFSSSSGDRTDRYIFVRTLRVGAEALVTWDHEPISQRVVAPSV